MIDIGVAKEGRHGFIITRETPLDNVILEGGGGR
jgi:hypothetical protein